MFNTILTSIKSNGETVQRVYQGRTEKLSVYFATNLWSTYDKDIGEELVSLETTDRDISNRPNNNVPCKIGLTHSESSTYFLPIIKTKAPIESNKLFFFIFFLF